MNATEYRRLRAMGIPPCHMTHYGKMGPQPEQLDWGEDRDYNKSATLERDGFEITVTLKIDEYATWEDALNCIGEVGWESIPDYSYADPPGEPTGAEKLRGTYLLERQRFSGLYLHLEMSEEDHYRELRERKYGKADARDLARQYAERAVKRAEAWQRGDWFMGVLVATATRHGIELGEALLGGVESDAGDDYLNEMAADLIEEALDEARVSVAALCTPV